MKVLNNNDTLQTRAMVNVVLEVEGGRSPDPADIAVLVEAFRAVMGGEDPGKIFGHRLGLAPPPGRPQQSGFGPSYVVGTFVELEYRRLGQGKGALTKAKYLAAESCVDIGGDCANRMRIIERDWRSCKHEVGLLSTGDLQQILRPYLA